MNNQTYCVSDVLKHSELALSHLLDLCKKNISENGYKISPEEGNILSNAEKAIDEIAGLNASLFSAYLYAYMSNNYDTNTIFEYSNAGKQQKKEIYLKESPAFCQLSPNF